MVPMAEDIEEDYRGNDVAGSASSGATATADEDEENLASSDATATVDEDG